MDEATRDALRERNRRRGNCGKCGGRTRIVNGSDLPQADHFPTLRYRICVACGAEMAMKSKDRR